MTGSALGCGTVLALASSTRGAAVVAVAGLATFASATAARRRSLAAIAGGRLSGSTAAPAVPGWFDHLARRVDASVEPERLWMPVVQSGVVVAVAAVVVAPMAAAVAAVVAVIAVRAREGVRRRSRQVVFDTELVTAVDRTVASLATGASIPEALADAATPSAGGAGEPSRGGRSTVTADLRTVIERRDRGMALQDALDRWAASRPGTGAALVADSLALASDAGGSRRMALDGVSTTLRERHALRREVRALGSQAQTSAGVLVVAPLAFSVAVAVADSRVRGFLVATPAGWVCTTAGLLLDLVGGWWMHRLIEAVR